MKDKRKKGMSETPELREFVEKFKEGRRKEGGKRPEKDGRLIFKPEPHGCRFTGMDGIFAVYEIW